PIEARRCRVWLPDIGVDSGETAGAVVVNTQAIAVWVAVIDVTLRPSRRCGGDQDARNQNKFLHGCTSSFQCSRGNDRRGDRFAHKRLCSTDFSGEKNACRSSVCRMEPGLQNGTVTRSPPTRSRSRQKTKSRPQSPAPSPVMASAISRRFADRFRAGLSARSSWPHLNQIALLTRLVLGLTTDLRSAFLTQPCTHCRGCRRGNAVIRCVVSRPFLP